jgi:hypothetical protein
VATERDRGVGPSSGPRPVPAARSVAVAIYVFATVAFAITASADLFKEHTPFNHFALLADAWQNGRLDLGGAPPEYTGYNDFAVYDGKYFISFPPAPAILILPLVALSGGADHVRDGLFFLGLAGLAPAVLYLALDRLARLGLSRRSWLENLALAGLFALGTVYWFSAVQGTVWFAAHVVGAVVAAGFLWASAGASNPAIAGLCLGLGVATRTPLLFAAPLFALELFRIHRWDGRAMLRPIGRFALPLAIVLVVLAWHNAARFGDAFEFGHRHLDVVWKPRIEKWGLFSLHYLGRNLGVMLASTPYLGVKGAPFAVSAHGLALWITSPFYLYALWPKRLPRTSRVFFCALAVTAAAVAIPSLLYQNTGWIQFGYRFSNDFSIFLIAMIAVGRRRLGPPFLVLGAIAVAINLFGALSFQRPGWERFYVFERKANVIFEAD